jgi:CxxC motif-containing protein (DUF1111 family)
VLLHDGEAATAQRAYRESSAKDRAAVIAFVKSL